MRLLPRAHGLAPLLIAGNALTLLFTGVSSHGQVAEVLVALVLPHLAKSAQSELELLWLVLKWCQNAKSQKNLKIKISKRIFSESNQKEK